MVCIGMTNGTNPLHYVTLLTNTLRKKLTNTMTNTNDTHKLHTIKDIMNTLDCSRSTIYNTMNKHNLSFIKQDNVNYIDDKQLSVISNTIMMNKHKQPKQHATQQHEHNQHNTHDNVTHEHEQHTNEHTQHTSNTTNDNDINMTIEQYKQRIKELKEQHDKHVADLNRQLDSKDRQIEQLTVSMTMQGLGYKDNKDDDSSSVRGVVVDSGSSKDKQGATKNTQDYGTKAHRTNEDSSHTDIVDSSRTNGATHTDYVGDTIEGSNDIGVSNIEDSNKGNTNVGNSTNNINGGYNHASNSNGGIDSTNNNDQSDNSYNGKIGFFKRLFGK